MILESIVVGCAAAVLVWQGLRRWQAAEDERVELAERVEQLEVVVTGRGGDGDD